MFVAGLLFGIGASMTAGSERCNPDVLNTRVCSSSGPNLSIMERCTSSVFQAARSPFFVGLMLRCGVLDPDCQRAPEVLGLGQTFRGFPRTR